MPTLPSCRNRVSWLRRITSPSALISMKETAPSFSSMRSGNPSRVSRKFWHSERRIVEMPSSQRALMDATKKRAEKLQAKGKQVDFKEVLRMEPDGGTTNIRNVSSAHWKRWLGTEQRCLVPFTSFSDYDTIGGKKVPVWFAPDESRPLIAFAGLWTNWTGV